jgi:hypothetical protein
VYTQSTIVRDALAEQGIALEPADVVSLVRTRVSSRHDGLADMVRDVREQSMSQSR